MRRLSTGVHKSARQPEGSPATVTVRVGINGFGRIGRNFFHAIVASGADVEVVGINDLAAAPILAHFLKYDSILGRFGGTIEATEGELIVNGRAIKVLSERDPAALPWKELGADVVVESTGLFTNGDDARATASARKALRKLRKSCPFFQFQGMLPLSLLKIYRLQN